MTVEKVYNITDVSTPLLVRQGLVSAHLQVGGKILAPGACEVFQSTPGLLAQTAKYRAVGALCFGDPPASYFRAKHSEEVVPEGDDLLLLEEVVIEQGAEEVDSIVLIEAEPPETEVDLQSKTHTSKKRRFRKG